MSCGRALLVAKDGQPLLLGVDLGTTAIKASIHRPDGSVVATSFRENQLHTPEPSFVEVPVLAYWSAFSEVVREVLSRPAVDRRRVVAIGLSAQGETFVPVSADGAPLRDAIVWLDNRAADEAAELEDRFGKKTVYEVTGQPGMVPTWPAAKVLWLLRHEPAMFDRVAKILLLEDYFLFRLSGEYVCEGSLVTSTCYWDFRSKKWWPEMLEAIGLEHGQLPTLVEPGSVVGSLLPAVAEELGLAATTLVCAGALDQACGAIGVGNVTPGILSENTGTAVALCATLDAPMLDPELRMPCHYHGIPDRYMFHTFTSGGVALRWFRDEFCDAEQTVARLQGLDAYDVMTQEAERVPPGCQGVLVLPHLQGAMAPESNPEVRATLLGLSLGHGRGHVTRAILEAIAFVIRRNVEVLEDLGVAVTSIRASGGGARSRLWKQIEADVTKRPVLTTDQPDAATLGACILAAVGVGLYSDVAEAARATVRLTDTFEPDASRFEVYDRTYATYRAAYEALCPVYEASSARA